MNNETKERMEIAYQAAGWMYAEACLAMDNEEDFRKKEIPELLDRMEKDLSRELYPIEFKEKTMSESNKEIHFQVWIEFNNGDKDHVSSHDTYQEAEKYLNEMPYKGDSYLIKKVWKDRVKHEVEGKDER